MEGMSSFPTPQLLQQANRDYTTEHKGKPLERDSNGRPLPYPPPTSKKEIFDPDKFQEIDQHAIQVEYHFTFICKVLLIHPETQLINNY